MKIIRWMLGICIVILAIIAIAVALLVNFINPNDYRNQISQTISDKIHMPFAIQGDIDWLFFPELGFKVNNITIGNTGSKELAAKVNRLEINLKILPLLHKQIAIEALRLSGLQLALPYKDPNSPDQFKATSNSDSATTQNPLSGLAALPSLNLDDLSIDQANISQLGKDGKPSWELHNFTFSGMNISADNQFPIQSSFDFVSPSQNMSGSVKFKTYFTVHVADQKMTLSQPNLDFVLNKTAHSSLKGNLALKDINVNFEKHTLSLDQLKGNIGNLTVNSDIKVKNFDTTPSATGQLQAQASNLRAVLESLDVSLPNTQNANAFGSFILNTQFNFANNQLALNPFNMTLGSTQLQGTINSPDVKNLAFNLNLITPALAAGDYLPKSDTAKKINIDNLKLNLNVLPPAGDNKNWIASTLNGNVAAQSIQLDDQHFTNLQLGIDGKNQVLRFNKIHLDAFKGTVDGTAQINLQNSEPQIALAPVIKGIHIEDLLSKVQPKFKLAGIANLSGSISTQGSDAKNLTRNLNGNLKAEVVKGVLHGINSEYWLNALTALYNREPVPPQPKNATTPFNSMSASLNINQGVVTNRDFLLQSNFARATGQGEVNLNSEILNYHLQIVKVNQQTGKAHNDIVPLNITGTFDNPSVQPDMQMIAQQVISKQVNKYKGKITEQINNAVSKQLGGDAGNQVGQAIGNALGNLLGGGK